MFLLFTKHMGYKLFLSLGLVLFCRKMEDVPYSLLEHAYVIQPSDIGEQPQPIIFQQPAVDESCDLEQATADSLSQVIIGAASAGELSKNSEILSI